MRRVLFLDSGPLGMVTHPGGDERTRACAQWFKAELSAGTNFVLPEVCDYEVRRELLRARRLQSVARLDILRTLVTYLPISSPAMLHAAKLWAWARHQGFPTASDKALDGDVILAAQAATYASNESCEVIIVTENVGHLERLGQASPWDNLPPRS